MKSGQYGAVPTEGRYLLCSSDPNRYHMVPTLCRRVGTVPVPRKEFVICHDLGDGGFYYNVNSSGLKCVC